MSTRTTKMNPDQKLCGTWGSQICSATQRTLTSNKEGSEVEPVLKAGWGHEAVEGKQVLQQQIMADQDLWHQLDSLQGWLDHMVVAGVMRVIAKKQSSAFCHTAGIDGRLGHLLNTSSCNGTQRFASSFRYALYHADVLAVLHHVPPTQSLL